MKRLVLSCTCCTLALVLTSLALAADQPAGKKGKKAKKAAGTPAVFKLPITITLTAEQQAKVDEIKTQYASKWTDAQKKIADIYTAEQLAAKQTARKEAVAAGKKGKQLKGAVDAAVTLSDEQAQKLSAAETEMKQLSKEIRKAIADVLTAEQRQSIKGKGKK